MFKNVFHKFYFVKFFKIGNPKVTLRNDKIIILKIMVSN